MSLDAGGSASRLYLTLVAVELFSVARGSIPGRSAIRPQDRVLVSRNRCVADPSTVALSPVPRGEC